MSRTIGTGSSQMFRIHHTSGSGSATHPVPSTGPRVNVEYMCPVSGLCFNTDGVIHYFDSLPNQPNSQLFLNRTNKYRNVQVARLK